MNCFGEYSLQILETIVVVTILVLVNVIYRKWSARIAKRFHLGLLRRKITIKVINLVLALIGIILVTGIWGLDLKQLFLFFSSTITVLGIGFFASWSILSNIT